MPNNNPYWPPQQCTLSASGIISEALGSLTVSWPAAIDPDGNTIWYDVNRVTSNHGIKLIYHGTDTSYTDTSFTYDDCQVELGQSVYYNVSVQDEFGLWAPDIKQSPIAVRNYFEPASLEFKMDHPITFATDEFLCIVGSPSNLSPSLAFTYNLTCDKVTVYNPTVSLLPGGDIILHEEPDPSSILIWRTGDPVPATPYVKFSELAVALRSTYYKGHLVFTLATTNEFGTSKSKTAAMYVDLATVPAWPTPNFQYTGGYTINSHLYYLPDVRGITVSWDAAIEQLENFPVYYDVEYKLSAELEWTKVVFETTALSATIYPPSNDAHLTYNIRVTAKTTYDKYVKYVAPDIVIDKYLRPLFGLTNKKRNATSVALTLNITPRTSILPADYSLSTLEFLKCNKATYVPLPTTNWKPSFEYGVAPYADAAFTKLSSYTMICRCKDSLGAIFGGVYANLLTLSIPINSYVPMFSIRKKGVAINDINDGINNFIFKVKGKINSITDDLGFYGYYENGLKIPVPVSVTHYANGCLIDLGDAAAAATQNAQFIVRIVGNSGFSKNAGVDTLAQANYRSNQTWLAYVQHNSGIPLAGLKFFTDGGRVKCWFKQTADWQVFAITAYSGAGSLPITVTNAAEPTGTNKVQCVIRLASQEIFDAVYPVGNVYLSLSSTNPATLFGGQWTALPNVFLFGAGSIAAAGVTGGEQNHTLGMTELPLNDLWISSPSYSPGLDAAVNAGSNYGIRTLNAGGGLPHNNMPPFLSVYMWRRTSLV